MVGPHPSRSCAFLAQSAGMPHSRPDPSSRPRLQHSRSPGLLTQPLWLHGERTSGQLSLTLSNKSVLGAQKKRMVPTKLTEREQSPAMGGRGRGHGATLAHAAPHFGTCLLNHGRLTTAVLGVQDPKGTPLPDQPTWHGCGLGRHVRHWRRGQDCPLTQAQANMRHMHQPSQAATQEHTAWPKSKAGTPGSGPARRALPGVGPQVRHRRGYTLHSPRGTSTVQSQLCSSNLHQKARPTAVTPGTAAVGGLC